MTLKQLAVFAAVAQEGTVTRASDAVKLTQSAASMALADLEDALDTPLFDRVGKRLQLNELGAFLLPQALEILGRCEDFEQAARGQKQQTDLKLGATLTISDYLMPNLMATFLNDKPDAYLSLQVGNTSSIIDAVCQFQLDLGFIEGSCHLPQLDVIPWQEDEMCVCCAPEHQLAQKIAQGNTLNITDFEHIQWIHREQGSGTREVFDREILPSLNQLNLRLELGHNEAIIKVVAGGLGVCCVSRLAVAEHLKNKTLVGLPTPFWQLKRQLYLLTHKQKYQSPGLKQFLNYCLQQTMAQTI